MSVKFVDNLHKPDTHEKNVLTYKFILINMHLFFHKQSRNSDIVKDSSYATIVYITRLSSKGRVHLFALKKKVKTGDLN